MRSRSLPVGASSAARAVYPLFALILCVGCSWADFTGPPPLPAEVSPDAVRVRMIAPATLDTVGPAARPAPTGSSSSAPVPPASAEPTEVFALPQAVDFGVQNNPRLAAALAAIEAARGQVDVAFSAFLPEIDFLTHEGITNPNLGPAAAGQTGIILPSATATHAFA